MNIDWKTACKNDNRVDWINESIKSGEIKKIIKNEYDVDALEILQDCIDAKDKESVDLLIDNGIIIDEDYFKALILSYESDKYVTQGILYTKDNVRYVDPDYCNALTSLNENENDKQMYKILVKFLIHNHIELKKETCDRCLEYRELVDNNFHSEAETIGECGGCK